MKRTEKLILIFILLFSLNSVSMEVPLLEHDERGSPYGSCEDPDFVKDPDSTSCVPISRGEFRFFKFLETTTTGRGKNSQNGYFLIIFWLL